MHRHEAIDSSKVRALLNQTARRHATLAASASTLNQHMAAELERVVRALEDLLREAAGKPLRCRPCKGEGHIEVAPGMLRSCQHCGGTGEPRKRQPSPRAELLGEQHQAATA